MRISRIPKGNGKYRTIYMPNHLELRRLRAIARQLNDLQVLLCDHSVVHGFFPGRSPVSNATRHIGHQATLSMDIKDFFDSVTRDHVSDILMDLNECFVDGAARQGLPTSPALANLAMREFDRRVKFLCQHEYGSWCYTRYADDLAISFDVIEPNAIIDGVMEIADDLGFTMNEGKTKLQLANQGRRIVTGVGVDHAGVYPTRKMKRKLRAARHQENQHQSHGLREWCKTKLPSEYRAELLREVKRLEKTLGVEFTETVKRSPRKTKLTTSRRIDLEG